MIKLKIVAALAIPLAATGCATPYGIAEDPSAGFATVADRTTPITAQKPVWIQNGAQARETAAEVSRIVKDKPLDADTAVKVALLNNKGLQAAYAELGVSAADLWQQTLPVNPTLSVGINGVGLVRTLEATIVGNILALFTQPRRVALADARFHQAQLRAADATLRLAADARRAWIEAVTARERLSYLNQAEVAADAAAELAARLGETGAYTKSGQAREQVFYAELAGQTAGARLNARLAREALARSMGLWGDDLAFKLPSYLPSLPKQKPVPVQVEAAALRNRADLGIAKLELEAMVQTAGLTEVSSYLTDIELLAGVEVEREREADHVSTTVGYSIGAEAALVIPIFDTGAARRRKAEYQYLIAANRLAELAVNVRSEARAAFDRYRSTYDIARHYRASVVPLRAKIEEEGVLTYNGMITNTFELLADTRAKIDAVQLALNAKRDFWLAEVELATAIHGGGAGAAAPASEAAAPASAAAGH